MMDIVDLPANDGPGPFVPGINASLHVDEMEREEYANGTVITRIRRRYRRIAQIPIQFKAEAERRWASAPTPDGERQCLNRCCLPFYEWVRQQTDRLRREVAGRMIARGIPVADVEKDLEQMIQAHPHTQQAPHWFEAILTD